MQHITIYRKKGRYAGWPANYGIWAWDDEIVLGFTAGYLKADGGFHPRDKNRPFTTMLARSLDGGLSWKTENFSGCTPDNRGLSADEHVSSELSAKHALKMKMENIPTSCPGDINFTHPDFALMCARTGLGAGTVSWFYVSYERCKTWEGPFSLPMFGQAGIEARTDYLVSGTEECMLFLTASKASGGEGKGVFCVKTTDGGKTFRLVSWVTPKYDKGFAIMPSSVRLSESHILVAVRCRGDKQEFTEAQHWIDLYASEDNATTWNYVNKIVSDTGMGGNPPMLNKLQDGRLCLTYGYRAEPYGIRAKLSMDNGVTWSKEIVLRDDAGNHDIGYPRTVQRTDGTVVTVYYYNNSPDTERYIAATLWKP